MTDGEWMEPSEVNPLTGEESFGTSGLTVNDYWSWGYSDLRQNVDRGILAEFLVASAVGDERRVRYGWDDFDVLHPSGTKIEVKSSAYLQSWKQKKLSTISFSGLKARAHDPDTLELEGEPSYRADVFVFAVQCCQAPEAYDMLDLNSWEFVVVPVQVLRDLDQKSISLSRLKSLGFEPVTYSQLKSSIEKEGS